VGEDNECSKCKKRVSLIFDPEMNINLLIITTNMKTILIQRAIDSRNSFYAF
jgi:hypothetical protein